MSGAAPAHPWRVRPLRPADLDATAALLARAFADTPAYAWMFPRAARRPRDLRRWFRRGLVRHADLTWLVVDDADVAVGTATLEAPDGPGLSLPETLRTWVFPTLLGPGPTALQRQFAASTTFAHHNRAAAGADTWWYVNAVAVDPDRQGAGAGSALLRHVFAALDARLATRPAPVVLTTQAARNVALYARFGFEDVGAFPVGGPDGFVSWSMRRR